MTTSVDVPAGNERNSSQTIECCICCETMDSHHQITQTVCNHRYHTWCINRWLERNSTCPICRHILREMNDHTPENTVILIDEDPVGYDDELYGDGNEFYYFSCVGTRCCYILNTWLFRTPVILLLLLMLISSGYMFAMNFETIIGNLIQFYWVIIAFIIVVIWTISRMLCCIIPCRFQNGCCYRISWN
jgi:hypothetical protein